MDNGLTQAWIFHREEHFHPTVEVAWHQIGASEQHLVLATVTEIVHTCVLQKAPDNGRDRNVLTHAGDTRTQTADPPHLQVDLHPGL